MKMSTKEAAKGKWLGILSKLLSASESTQALSRKHGPCPMCGGKDRYRYDDKHQNGDFYCNVCGAGNGFELLMKVKGVEFAEAARMVDEVVGNIEPAEPFQPHLDIESRRRLLNNVWTGAKSPELVREYLVRRGLDWKKIEPYAVGLRGTSNLYDTEGDVMRAGMVALVLNAAGEPISIHRTFFATDQLPAAKKLMPPIEEIKSSYVKLGEPSDALVVGEGIETTLAGCQQYSLPGASALSAHNMKEFHPPRFVKHVIVLADNDHSFDGQRSAFELAYRLRNQNKLKVEVAMPAEAGSDFCDYVNAGGNIRKWSGGTPNGK